MLKYEIKLNNIQKSETIDLFDEIKLAHNGDFIFGRTTNNIYDGQYVKLEINDGIENTLFNPINVTLPINVETKHYCGYFEIGCIYDKYITNGDDQIQFYIDEYKSIHKINQISDEVILKKYFIENDYVVINDSTYTVSYDKNNIPYILMNTKDGVKKINGVNQDIHLNEFKINRQSDQQIQVNRISYVKKQEYVTVNGVKYYVDNNKVNINGEVFGVIDDTYNITSDWDGDYDYQQTIYDKYIIFDDSKFMVYFEWVETNYTQNNIIITVLGDNVENLNNNNWFIAKIYGNEYQIPIIDKIANNSYICNVSIINEDDIDLVKNEYQTAFYIYKNTFGITMNLLYPDKITNYDLYWYDKIKDNIILKNVFNGFNIPLNIAIDNDNTINKEQLITDNYGYHEMLNRLNTFVDMEHDVYYPQFRGEIAYIINNGVEYKVSSSNKMGYVLINGVDFKLESQMYIIKDGVILEIEKRGNNYYIDSEQIDIIQQQYIDYQNIAVVNTTSDVVNFSTYIGNEYYALVNVDDGLISSFLVNEGNNIVYTKTNVGYEFGDTITIIENVDSNTDGYVVADKSINKEGFNVGIKTNTEGYYIVIDGKYYTSKTDRHDDITTERIHYITINGTNYDVKNRQIAFFDGVYYEIQYGEKYVYFYGNKCNIKYKETTTLVEELKFYLHFLNENINVNRTNSNKEWNIFNQIYYPNQNLILNSSIDAKYFQPSDILGFLGFTDDDVYNQRLNVSKSFIRLMFFDSKNPSTQNLLHTSTIFLDENKLYSKYFKSDDKIYKRNVKNGRKTNTIGVDLEPLKDNNFSFDENQRISSEISVKNKHKTEVSSDGFYLYLFKNFLNGEVEKEIYLRIQFNHAGIGKTINMVFPYKNDGDDVRLLDFSYTNDTELINFKNGISILDELNEKMYLPIKIQYDNNINKYVYFLPKNIYPTSDYRVMKFNLYEPKIKDESNLFVQ